VTRIAWIAWLVAVPVVLGALAGGLGAVLGAAFAIVAALYAWLWLPRSAHGAFQAGRFARATRRYRVLGWIAVSAARERSALLSRAGCAVAAGETARADELLASLDGTALVPAERAVWLNNRACAALAAGRDPHAALALADEAGALRPDVPTLQHTRGIALLAVGRVDDAIAVLDGMRAAGELPERLEAERCRDLARAWRAKGETAYADDYQARADGLRVVSPP
jgi:predicted Zn-dependent protease